MQSGATRAGPRRQDAAGTCRRSRAAWCLAGRWMAGAAQSPKSRSALAECAFRSAMRRANPAAGRHHTDLWQFIRIRCRSTAAERPVRRWADPAADHEPLRRNQAGTCGSWPSNTPCATIFHVGFRFYQHLPDGQTPHYPNVHDSPARHNVSTVGDDPRARA